MQDHTPDDATRAPLVPRTTASLRLTFAYDLQESNAGVRLLRVEQVRAVAPGLSTPPPRPGQSGAWFEMRDADGRLLYYQPVHDPMPTTREAFADAAGKRALSRVPVTQATGEFQLLVPDLPNAASFSFHATLPESGSSHQSPRPGARVAAHEIVRASFDEIRRRAEPLR